MHIQISLYNGKFLLHTGNSNVKFTSAEDELACISNPKISLLKLIL